MDFHPSLCAVADCDRTRIDAFFTSPSVQRSHMTVIPSNLCTLVEQLDDARQFHELAAEASDGLLSELQHERSQGYAAMLTEIGRWESRACQRDEVSGPGTTNHGSGHAGRDDGYAALMNRIARMQCALASVNPLTRIRAADNATDGEARGGRRRAEERMRC